MRFPGSVTTRFRLEREHLKSSVWRPAAALLPALLFSACVSAPSRTAAPIDAPASRYHFDYENLSAERLFRGDATVDARFVGPVSFSVDSALPLVQRDAESWFASSLSVGGSGSPLSYTASYSLKPGGVLDAEELERSLDVPQQLGGQQIGQNMRLQLPALAGAPLALDFSHESSDMWTLAGSYTRQQRQVAGLSWKPQLAAFTVQWAGAAAGRDGSLALDCGLRGQVRVPAPSRSGRAHALRFSGRACQVVSANARYAGLAAQTYGAAYLWSKGERESMLSLSAIDPVWQQGAPGSDIEPSYELGLTQSRHFGAWTAKALLAVRRAAAWDGTALAVDDVDAVVEPERDTAWTTTATLTRQLPALSVSASWAHGADPLWFMPDIGQQADRFGLAMDFSRWAQAVVPDLTPTLAMSWHWTQARTRQDERIGDRQLKLQLSVLW